MAAPKLAVVLEAMEVDLAGPSSPMNTTNDGDVVVVAAAATTTTNHQHYQHHHHHDHDQDQYHDQYHDQDHDQDHEDDDDAYTSAAQTHQEPQPRQHVVDEFCWLCQYQGNRTTNEVVRFIMDGIPHMAIDSLVAQSKYLLDHVEAESNTSLAQIRRHITEHMLHPRVKLALQLQEMSKMQKEVTKCCVVSDADTGERTVNPQAMRVYLTLCSQVSALYKVGEDKLIFNNSSMDK
jgi:hypothetical protein